MQEDGLFGSETIRQMRIAIIRRRLDEIACEIKQRRVQLSGRIWLGGRKRIEREVGNLVIKRAGLKAELAVLESRRA